MEQILKVEHLKKSYRKKEILKDISFFLCKGDIMALIGSNGTGKTTLIKTILGLQKSNKGNVYIKNIDIKKNYTKYIQYVGALVENPDLYPYLTGYENLKLLKNLYKNVTEDDILRVLKLMKLDMRKNELVNKYSLGMKQRLGIAKSLINKPELLILDEPTNGLDPSGINELRNILKNLAKEGVAIIISSHNLSELENFCNKVCLLKDGKISLMNSMQELKKTKELYLIEADNVKNIKIDNLKLLNEKQFIYKGNKNDVSKLIKTLMEKNICIYEVKKVEQTLEQVFLKEMSEQDEQIN